MTTRIECIRIGDALPHGGFRQIANRTGLPYEWVTRTLRGGVSTLNDDHEHIVTTALEILKERKIKIPK